MPHAGKATGLSSSPGCIALWLVFTVIYLGQTPITVGATEIKGSVRVHADVGSYAKTTGLSLQRAHEIAAEQDIGRCVAAELEVEDAFLIYEF
jgi:hypothetical protein